MPDDSLFRYDSSAALKLTDHVVRSCAEGTIHDITYTGAHGREVHAYLVIPINRGRYAAILFQHWANGTRAEFLGEACIYAGLGVVSLLPDYAWDTSPEQAPNHFTKPEIDRRTEIDAVVDARRGLDVLLARDDVEPRRVAVVGHSFGAQWASILAAVDRRMRSIVLIAGAGSEEDLLLLTDNRQLVELRKSLPTDTLAKYCDDLADLSAIRYLPRATGVQVLLQFGSFDQLLSTESMHRFASVAPQSATVKLYDADHEVNDPGAFKDRHRWLISHLDLIRK